MQDKKKSKYRICKIVRNTEYKKILMSKNGDKRFKPLRSFLP